MEVKPENYILLMFSMKGVVKRVDFNHIKEKILRDVNRFPNEEIKKFEGEDASIERTIEKFRKRGNEFILKESNTTELIQTFI